VVHEEERCDLSASTVRQTLQILEMLAPEPAGVRVSRIAEALQVNKAIAFRLLTALREAGYVQQDPVTETYRATYRLGALGLRQVEGAGIHGWAQEPIDRLARRTQELVRLAVVTDRHLHWVAKAQGSNSQLVVDPVMGAEVVLHATATGKAWLSTLGEEELRAVLSGEQLARPTPRTTTDLSRLEEELAAARANGYAMTFEEMDVGIVAVAVPVFGAGRSVPATGTVSVAGPSARLERADLLGFVPDLLSTAEELASSWPAYTYLAGNSAGVA
jgi:DNA-binding IclR family transcriptional regulator